VLAIDIMFLSGIPFLVTISRDIHFGTAVALPNQSKKSITKALTNVINNYKVRGFTVHTILGDGQLECLENVTSNMGISLNTTSNNEHVPEIERYIRKRNAPGRQSTHYHSNDCPLKSSLRQYTTAYSGYPRECQPKNHYHRYQA